MPIFGLQYASRAVGLLLQALLIMSGLDRKAGEWLWRRINEPAGGGASHKPLGMSCLAKGARMPTAVGINDRLSHNQSWTAASFARMRRERNQMSNNELVRETKGGAIIRAIALLVVSLLIDHTCTGATATFQSGTGAPFGSGAYTGAEDTMLLSNTGAQEDQNFGARSDFEVGERVLFTSYPRHILIRFDVTSFAGRFLSISNVTLRLYVTFANEINAGDTILVHRLSAANANWVEGTEVGANIGDPPDIGMSTWARKVQGAANWAGSAGASTPGVDYISTPVASYPYGWEIVGTYIDLVFTNISFFTDWISGTNSGLLLRTATQLNSAIGFASSQSATREWRPQLVVHYTPTTPETNVLSIRVSQVELCWPSMSNTLYQVQYRSDLTTNIWTDLGTPVQGNGLTNCIYDAVLPGQPQRFYRFVTSP